MREKSDEASPFGKKRTQGFSHRVGMFGDEENVRAVDIKLEDADLAKLNEAFVPGSTAGTRYPPRQMGNMGR